MKKSTLFCVFLVLSSVFNGCIEGGDNPIAPNAVLGTSEIENVTLKDITAQIAKLPKTDESNIDSLIKFEEFTDKLTDLVDLLNENMDLEIPRIEASEETYKKVSHVVKECSPLIDNYNEVIDKARNYNENDNESEIEFYVAVAKLGLEVTLIVTAAFYIPAYKGVGMAYRASGLNKLAVKHPRTIRIILSHAHSFVRNKMVAGSSETFGMILTTFATKEGFKNIRKEIMLEVDEIEDKKYNAAESIQPILEKAKNETMPYFNIGANKARTYIDNFKNETGPIRGWISTPKITWI